VTPGSLSLSLYATPLDGTPPLDNTPLDGTSLAVALYKTPLDGTSLQAAVYTTPLDGTSLDVALYTAADADDDDDEDSGAPFPPLDPRLSHERIPPREVAAWLRMVLSDAGDEYSCDAAAATVLSARVSGGVLLTLRTPACVAAVLPDLPAAGPHPNAPFSSTDCLLIRTRPGWKWAECVRVHWHTVSKQSGSECHGQGGGCGERARVYWCTIFKL